VCNHCGEDLGIGPYLLGTTEEHLILSGFSCNRCKLIRESETRRCVIEGCDNWQRLECNGHCSTHATYAQRDVINLKNRLVGTRCV
jgi:hypothetical protein